MRPPRTLQAVHTAARELKLDPEWACGGKEVQFACPQCRADGLKALARARVVVGGLVFTCGGCQDLDEPGILAILAGAAPNDEPRPTWWEPPLRVDGTVNWPGVARSFVLLTSSVRSDLVTAAMLASEFEAGVVMGIEQRERWDAIVSVMRELEHHVIYLDDAILTAATLDLVREEVAS